MMFGKIVCFLKRDHQWMFERLQRHCVRCDKQQVFNLREDAWQTV